MKKYLNIAFAYAIAAMVGGVFYREFTKYSGFTGSVLERGYPYNQSLADRYLLVEFGNNRNDITDVRSTARIWGKILAQALKAGY